jgi:acyl-CoA hydrolase
MAPVELEADRLDLTRWVRPGSGVVASQACGEPVVLVDALIEAAGSGALDGVSYYCGLTWREVLAAPEAAGIDLVSYGVLGALARVAAVRPVRVVPSHFSAHPGLFAHRELPGDVALIQVAPPGPDGRCSFGVDTTYIADAVLHAHAVIAEVNAQMPRVRGASIAYDELTAVVHTDRPLLEAPPARETEADRAIAAHAVALVRDGDTLQVGVGALPEAILRGVQGARDLGIHSGMICDPVVDLVASGTVTGARKPVDTGLIVTGAALGSSKLFAFLDGDERVVQRPVSFTHRADTLTRVGRLVAINGAVEVDLTGQVNAERAGTRMVGAVGGQVDFLRGAAASGGEAVVALPSVVAKTGATRIVARLSGPVTTARADVEVVVTEHGVARLRGLDLAERAAALIAIAAPEHREALAREAVAAGLQRGGAVIVNRR